MGAIKDLLTREVRHLEVEYRIGRARGCSLRLLETFVSAQHATLSWTGACWLLRDLMSRNGTFVDGRRLPAGSCHPLLRGARIAFGTAASHWELIDASPPAVLVTSLAAARQMVAYDGILAIPSRTDPRAMLYRNSEGRWVVEKPNESITPIAPMQTFTLGDDSWRFSSPPEPPEGAGDASVVTRMAHVQLNFLVSSRDEPLQVQITYADRTIDLGVAECDRLLLALARRRLSDDARGVGPAASGWVDEEELASELAPRRFDLNAEICCVRQQFSRAEVLDPGTIVSRRPRTRQLRIGTERIAIAALPFLATHSRAFRG